jgi:hypothetical protein
MKITWVQVKDSIESPDDGQERYHIPCSDKTRAWIIDQCVAMVGPRASILVPLANVRWMRFEENGQNPSREASVSQGSRSR